MLPTAQHASTEESFSTGLAAQVGLWDQSQGCTESKANGREFTPPRVPPDSAELPLKPGWSDVVLLPSEPLQGRQFLLDLTGARMAAELAQELTGGEAESKRSRL